MNNKRKMKNKTKKKGWTVPYNSRSVLQGYTTKFNVSLQTQEAKADGEGK
jgi:hypothetical protein